MHSTSSLCVFWPRVSNTPIAKRPRYRADGLFRGADPHLGRQSCDHQQLADGVPGARAKPRPRGQQEPPVAEQKIARKLGVGGYILDRKPAVAFTIRGEDG